MKNIITALTITVLFLLPSCSSDFLETKSTQGIGKDEAFATTDNARAALNGLHRLMYYPGSSQNYMGFETMMMMNDMMGEDLVFTKSQTLFLTAYKWQLHRTESSAMLNWCFRFFYTLLYNANAIIANTPDAVGEQEDRDEIIGQALAYRAFLHFNTVQLWAERYVPGQQNMQPGIPLMMAPTIEPQARSTVELVYQKINEDLDKAIELLENAPERKTKMHINLYVAKGLKARVALTQGLWETAAKYAAEAQQMPNLQLSDVTYTERPRFCTNSNTEWMWGTVRVQEQNSGWNTLQSLMGDANSLANRTSPRAIYNSLYAKISTTDVRKNIWAATDKIAKTFIFPPKGYTCQYMANKYLVADQTSGLGDVPYMRLPEMLLIEAEARAYFDETGAKDALYKLAHFRDPQYVRSGNNGQKLIEEIWIQRRIELWGEGFRFIDLKRSNLPLNRQTGAGSEKTNHNSTLAAKVLEVENTDIRWQYLYPDNETQNNPLLEQNPFE